MTFRNKINLIIGIMVTIAVTSCNNGASNTTTAINNNPTPNTTKLAVSIIGANEIPLTESNIQLPYIIKNNSPESLFNINYSVNEITNTGNLENNQISIDQQSMADCKVLDINETCTLIVNIASGAKAGSISISASINQQNQSISLQSILSLFSSTNSTTIIGMLNVGLNNFSKNIGSGTDGIAVIYDNTILQSTDISGNLTDYSNIVVTLLATSPNIGSYKSLILKDSNGNNVPFATLYGNPNSLQMPGDIAILEVKAPKNLNQISFAVVLNGSSSSNNISNIELVDIVSPVTTKIAILHTYPLSTQLTNEQPSQVVTIVNTGNAPATNINVNAGPNTKITNNSCTGTLNPSETCTYVISNEVSVNGSSYTDVTYFDNNSNQATANIINNGQISTGNTVGLQIISSNPNNNFITTDLNSSYTSLLELKNIGTKPITLLDFPTIPNYTIEPGSVNSCIANQILAANAECTLQIRYTNSIIGSGASSLNFSYTLQDQNNVEQTLSSGIKLTNNTVAATANILPTSIANIIGNNTSLNIGSIFDDSTSESSQTITLTNIGQVNATGFDISLNNNHLFAILNNTCTNSLSAGASCSFDIKFGPSNIIESTVIESTNVAIIYQTNGKSEQVSTNIGLSGEIKHSTNVAFVAGDNGIYKVDLSNGKTTQVYTNNATRYNSIARYGNIVVAVGTNTQIAASTDGGATWAAVDPKLGTSGDLNSITVNSSGLFELSGSGGITAQSSNGTSWTLNSYGVLNFTSIVPADNSGNFLTIASNATAPDVLLFGNTIKNMYLPQHAPYYSIDVTSNHNYLVGGYNSTLYLSINQGSSWVDKSLPVICARNTSLGNDNVNSITSNDSTSVAVGNCGYAIYSTDQGVTWTLSDYPINDTNYEDLNSVNFVNNSTWVAVGANGMLRLSADGQKWSVLPTGFNVTFRGVSN